MNDFQIGIITKPQGIRGEVRVLPTTDDPTRFEMLIGGEITVNSAAYKLTAARVQKNMVILKLAEINDRNAAEKLTGAAIFIPAEKAVAPGPDEYYIRDLIGLCAKSETGEILGEISDVFPTGANDVYVVKPPAGSSFMVPAIKDVVQKVDLTEGKIILRLMDGMRELEI